MSRSREFYDRATAHVRDVANAPPWYVRTFGGLFLLGSLGEYLFSTYAGKHPEGVLEVFVHIFFLLAGMVMIYPEGAGKMMAFARKAFPGKLP